MAERPPWRGAAPARHHGGGRPQHRCCRRHHPVRPPSATTTLVAHPARSGSPPTSSDRHRRLAGRGAIGRVGGARPVGTVQADSPRGRTPALPIPCSRAPGLGAVVGGRLPGGRGFDPSSSSAARMSARPRPEGHGPPSTMPRLSGPAPPVLTASEAPEAATVRNRCGVLAAPSVRYSSPSPPGLPTVGTTSGAVVDARRSAVGDGSLVPYDGCSLRRSGPTGGVAARAPLQNRLIGHARVCSSEHTSGGFPCPQTVRRAHTKPSPRGRLQRVSLIGLSAPSPLRRVRRSRRHARRLSAAMSIRIQHERRSSTEALSGIATAITLRSPTCSAYVARPVARRAVALTVSRVLPLCPRACSSVPGCRPRANH